MLSGTTSILRAGLAAVAATIILASPGLQANPYDPVKIGPAVGTTIPRDLTARDQHGQERNFKALAHKRGLVILFSKSLDW